LRYLCNKNKIIGDEIYQEELNRMDPKIFLNDSLKYGEMFLDLNQMK
jgi:hypothetical protein